MQLTHGAAPSFGAKMLRCAVALWVLVSIASPSTYLRPHHPKPDKFKDVEGCYIEELDEVIPFEQGKASREECLEYFCTNKTLSYASCGFVEALPPCNVFEEKDKPYPDCCQRVMCPPDDNSGDGLVIQ